MGNQTSQEPRGALAPSKISDTGESWRDAASLDNQVLLELKNRIEAYTPDANWNVNRVNILMVGQSGAGKSSFINTISSIFKGRITQACISGSNCYILKMVTTTYRQHVIQSEAMKRILNFTLCDAYGLQDEPNVDNADLKFILEGNIKDRYKFKYARPITPNEPEYRATPACRDKMHCVVFVCDATTIAEFSEYCFKDLHKLLEPMNAEGVPRAVVLTKIDKLSKCLDLDVSTVFQNRKVSDAVEAASAKFGVPRGYIHPVKNYEKETCLKEKISCLALMALDHILGYADDFVRNNQPNSQNDGNETE